jgi:glycosyltransferase involved in cell wall biosynthesis
MNPRVTVLLPVHNGEQFLQTAIDSILKQSFTDFELLLINDGSTDQTEQIIEHYKDDRITYISHKANIGLVRSLNNGIIKAKGELIARMDCDDIAHPQRLEKQLNYLDRHQDVDVLGCQIGLINDEEEEIGDRIYPLEHHAIKLESLLDCPMPHPAVMFRKEKMVKFYFFYDRAQRFTEDYELWQRAFSTLGFANLNEKLLRYRINNSQISSQNKELQEAERRYIRTRYLFQLGLNAWNDQDRADFLNFLDYRLVINRKIDAVRIYRLLDETTAANRHLRIFDQELLCKMIAFRMDQLVSTYTDRKNNLYSGYANHEWSGFSGLTGMQKIKLNIKSWLK